MKIDKIGNIYGFTGGSFAGMVYGVNGCAPALNTMGGGDENHSFSNSNQHKTVRHGICREKQKSKNMIISEQRGRLVGFQYDEGGFLFQVDAYPDSLNGVPQSFYFPFNQNRPKAFDLDEFRGKRVKITVEIEED